MGPIASDQIRIYASMGPRSNDRGNRTTGERRVVSGPASMGPRSNDRGNSDVPTYRSCAYWASMGPRSNDRGNDVKPLRFGRVDMLQWGRDQMIAEMAPATTTLGGVKSLQWGRDQMIAEISQARYQLEDTHA